MQLISPRLNNECFQYRASRKQPIHFENPTSHIIMSILIPGDIHLTPEHRDTIGIYKKCTKFRTMWWTFYCHTEHRGIYYNILLHRIEVAHEIFCTFIRSQWCCRHNKNVVYNCHDNSIVHLIMLVSAGHVTRLDKDIWKHQFKATFSVCCMSFLNFSY